GLQTEEVESKHEQFHLNENFDLGKRVPHERREFHHTFWASLRLCSRMGAIARRCLPVFSCSVRPGGREGLTSFREGKTHELPAMRCRRRGRLQILWGLRIPPALALQCLRQREPG